MFLEKTLMKKSLMHFVKAIIIGASVFIYSYLMTRKQINIFFFTGLEIYAENIRSAILKTNGSSTLALALLKFVVKAFILVSLLTTLVAKY